MYKIVCSYSNYVDAQLVVFLNSVFFHITNLHISIEKENPFGILKCNILLFFCCICMCVSKQHLLINKDKSAICSPKEKLNWLF